MTTHSGMSSMVGNSSGGSHDAEMELITDTSGAMTSMLLVIAVVLGGVMVVTGLVNTIVNMAQSKDGEDSHSDTTPPPEPEPAPAPEHRDAPSINVDSTAAIIFSVTVAMLAIVIVLVVLYK